MTRLWALAFTVTCAPAAAFAQSGEPRMSSQYEDCVRRAHGASTATIACVSEEHKRWDTELNHQYRAIRTRLDGGRRNSFDAAEHAWLGFRDANCGFYNDPGRGAAAGLDAGRCMLEMTARRVLELRRIRNQIERQP